MGVRRVNLRVKSKKTKGVDGKKEKRQLKSCHWKTCSMGGQGVPVARSLK